VSLPVPKWNDLPKYVQSDLDSIGVTKPIFDGESPNYSVDRLVRLSILNLYVKLKGVTLSGISVWDYIDEFKHAGVGVFDFTVSSMDEFKDALTREEAFANPGSKDDVWDSRELRYRLSLHFRHKTEYHYGPNGVASHIDPTGLFTGPGVWRKIAVGLELGIPAIIHGVCYSHFKHVDDIRDGLSKQGWDPATLFGNKT
jgi:hypothetical protein